MSFKDLFVKKDETEVLVPPKSDNKPAENRPSAAFPTIVPSSSSPQFYKAPTNFPVAAPANATTEHTDYIAQFNKILEEANTPELDFYEFSKTLEALANVPMSDQQKYIAAFATFTAAGIPVGKLLESSVKFKGLIESHSSGFSAHMTSLVAEKIDKRIEEAKNLKDRNEALSKEMQDNAARINTLLDEATQRKLKIDSEVAAYGAAYTQFTTGLQTIIDNIKNYLDGTTKQ